MKIPKMALLGCGGVLFRKKVVLHLFKSFSLAIPAFGHRFWCLKREPRPYLLWNQDFSIHTITYSIYNHTESKRRNIVSAAKSYQS